MMVSDAQKKATAKYQAVNRRRFQVVVNRKTEGDLLEWLEGVKNVSGYLKNLVREDMRTLSEMDSMDRSLEWFESKFGEEGVPPF